jgi:LPXTG-site transpeptidase (sortase) family protein
MRPIAYIGAAIVAVALIVFAVTLARATLFAPGEALGPAPAAVSVVEPGDVPMTLSIPVLGIHAAVQQTGITKSGAMGTPTNFTDVAWYKYGPAPGQVGSAVIDGHVDNGLSLAGVFKHLGDIKVGDDLYVTTKSGQELHFGVTDIEVYPYKDTPNDLIFNRTDKVRLNLITCQGTWVKGDKTYDERLVVFAELK